MPGTSNYPGGFSNGVTIQNMPVLNSYAGQVYWVRPTGATPPPGGVGPSDGNPGTFQKPFATIQKAVTVASATGLRGSVICLGPGEYDEAVTISRPTTNDGSLGLTIIGAGPRGSVFNAISTTNGVAFTNHADDVTFVNVGMDGDGTGAGLINTGSRLRVYGSKIEGDDIGATLTLGTVAQEAAGTRGVGADLLFADCETAWATTGIKLNATDYGAVTQVRFSGCVHGNHSAATFEEGNTGGSVDIQWRDLQIIGSTFGKLEDGTNPTKFLSLNDDNANSGLFTQCSFPVAANSGLNLVSTAMISTGNFFTGGISTGQPS